MLLVSASAGVGIVGEDGAVVSLRETGVGMIDVGGE